MQAFRKEVKEYAKRLRLPGLAVAVVQNGKIIYRQNEGYADVRRKAPIADDSLFWIASLTKTFSSVLMMQYLQEGKITLDDYLLQYPFTSVGFFPQRVNPNVKLKHILSQTSEGTPGEAFVYHGGRFNFLAGVFQKIAGKTDAVQALEAELRARIFQPLHLADTLAGYPAKGDAALKSRIVTPYVFDSAKQAFVATEDPYRFTVAYPATGLLSTMRDLAVYTSALDDDRLISQASYDRMTTPFINNRGQTMPYGLGWFTQRFAGLRLHWAYGFGNSDSALLLRVPDRKLTLIVLSNCTFLSEPCRLGVGNALRSPFVLAFLKHFVLQGEPDLPAIDYDGDMAAIREAFTGKAGKMLPHVCYEKLYTQALIRAFARNTFHSQSRKPEQLTQLLYDVDRAAFTKPDQTLIYLLSQLNGEEVRAAADCFIASYDVATKFHPETLFSVAKYYENRGETDKALKYYHILVDAPGYEEQSVKIDACSILGRYYCRQGNFEKGREYLWKAVVCGRQTGYDDSFVATKTDEMNRLTDQVKAQPSEPRDAAPTEATTATDASVAAKIDALFARWNVPLHRDMRSGSFGMAS